LPPMPRLLRYPKAVLWDIVRKGNVRLSCRPPTHSLVVGLVDGLIPNI
jgi:hypothetical protein